MTMQLTVTNTSNWANEDYVLKSTRDIRKCNSPSIYDEDGIRLRPGESYTFCPGDEGNIDIKAVKEHQPAPFVVPHVRDGKRHDKQVFPKVDVEFD